MICFIRGCHATEEALKADAKEQQRLKNVALDNSAALKDAVKVARDEADATRAEHLAYRTFSEAELAKVTDELKEQSKVNSAYMSAQWIHSSQCKEYERKLTICSETIDKRNEKIARLQSQISYLESVINPDFLKDMPKDEEPVISPLDAVPSESPLYVTEVENVTPESPLVVDVKPQVDSDCFQDDDGNLICSK